MAVLHIRNSANTQWIPIANIPSYYINDADADTGVYLERVADEDIIRFDCGGTANVLTLSASAIAGSLVKDEDNMASNSANHVCTQQSIKAYADTVNPAFEFIDSATASNDASVAFSGWDTAYYQIIVWFHTVEPASDQRFLYSQVSTDGGTSYLAGTNYDYGVYYHTDAGSGAGTGSGTAATQWMRITNYVGAAAGPPDEKGAAGYLHLINVNSTGFTGCTFAVFHQRYDAYSDFYHGGGYIMNNGAINAIKFYFNSGNIATGKFYIYGRRRA
jgi:hypothetical protein